jgi:bifunctional DNA-binding transcriptional regulator/antitoxin component of YhaV-PrlF toxin-antitoxin module
MSEDEILGTSKMSIDGKITLVSDVREMLGVSGGAIIVFCKSKKGEIVIRKGSIGVQ